MAAAGVPAVRRLWTAARGPLCVWALVSSALGALDGDRVAAGLGAFICVLLLLHWWLDRALDRLDRG